MFLATKVVRAASLILAITAMFSIAGGHWAVLQTIAWAQMLRDYSQSAPFAEAIGKTFSGEAPCAMCRKISEERQKQQNAPAALTLDSKADALFAAAAEAISRPMPAAFRYSATGPVCFAARSEAPPFPVPIGI